jgi:peroxiredoxin
LAVPGAFTTTCSQKHLPGFVDKSKELKAKGVNTIACISINDAFVMKAWKENPNINDEVLLLSDGNEDFTRAIGCELDLSDNPFSPWPMVRTLGRRRGRQGLEFGGGRCVYIQWG